MNQLLHSLTTFALCAAVFCNVGSASGASLSNDRYTLDVGDDGTVTLRTEGMSPQTVAPEFTVLRSERDPRIHRNFNHPNYPIAPRPSLRWLALNEPADVLNAWLATPAMKAAVAWNAVVTGKGEHRVWEYRDKSGKVRAARGWPQPRRRDAALCCGREDCGASHERERRKRYGALDICGR